MRELVEHVLDPAREELGGPIKVTSGYRSADVNKAVGGSPTSQHTKGQAADLVCSDNRKLFDIIRHLPEYDQLIFEFGDDTAPAWVHVSYVRSGKNRKQILRAKSVRGKTVYTTMKFED